MAPRLITLATPAEVKAWRGSLEPDNVRKQNGKKYEDATGNRVIARRKSARSIPAVPAYKRLLTDGYAEKEDIIVAQFGIYTKGKNLHGNEMFAGKRVARQVNHVINYLCRNAPHLSSDAQRRQQWNVVKFVRVSPGSLGVWDSLGVALAHVRDAWCFWWLYGEQAQAGREDSIKRVPHLGFADDKILATDRNPNGRVKWSDDQTSSTKQPSHFGARVIMRRAP